MWVTTSRMVWLASRGTSKVWNAPSLPPRQTETFSTSGALVEPCQDELAMSERFGRGQPAVGRAEHAVEQFVAGLVRGELFSQQAGDVDVDVLRHRAHGARIGAQLDHRQDRVADHVALAGREEVHRVAGGGAEP